MLFFSDFFKKLLQQISSTHQQSLYQQSEKKINNEILLQEQGTMIRHLLVLFYDFQSKKQTSLKKKLDQVMDCIIIFKTYKFILLILNQIRIYNF